MDGGTVRVTAGDAKGPSTREGNLDLVRALRQLLPPLAGGLGVPEAPPHGIGPDGGIGSEVLVQRGRHLTKVKALQPVDPHT